MSNPFIGEIRPFAFAFYPGDGNWLPCSGQTLAISQYQPLYSIIGTTYGGDGKATFALPNLNGAQSQAGLALLGAGQASPTSASYPLGAKTGVNTVTLTGAQMPVHNHTVTGINATLANTYSMPVAGTSQLSRCADAANVDNAYTDQSLAPAPATLNQAALSPFAGGSQAHDNMQPYQTFTFAIAVNGDYPPHP